MIQKHDSEHFIYYHLTHDNIFIDNVINLIEKTERINRHEFVVYNYVKENKMAKNKRIQYKSLNELLNTDFKLNKIKGVFLHCFSLSTLIFIMTLPSDIIVYWCFWGNELFSPNEYFSNILYDKKTSKLFFQLHKKRLTFIRPDLKSYFYRIMGMFDTDQRYKLKAMKRINYFCHFNEYDYNDYSRKYFKNAKHLMFYYTYPNNFLENIKPRRITSNSNKYILIGHSGNYSNNHLEIFDLFKKNIQLNRKILCPLSYGDKEYISYISQKGTEMFSGLFEIQNEFLSINDYIDLLSMCNPIIMNHYRSEAVNNIILILYLGKKVYMNPKSNFYKYLKSRKFVVYNVYDIKDCDNSFYSELSKEEIAQNQRLVLQYFSFDRSVQYMKNILEL